MPNRRQTDIIPGISAGAALWVSFHTEWGTEPGPGQERDDALLRIIATSIGRTGGIFPWRVRIGGGGRVDWGGLGKKERTKPLVRSSGAVASGVVGREVGVGGSRKRFPAQSSSAVAASRKFRHWADFAFLMARKYVCFAAMTASREEESGSGEEEQFASEEKEGLGRLDRW